MTFTFFASCLFAAMHLQTPTASCDIDTRGARITSWKVGGVERLWNQAQPRDAKGRWEHGGIPLAWPWFGRTGPGGTRTIHGFAWRQEFSVVRRTDTPTKSEVVLSAYSESFTADYTITLTDKLRLELRTTNVSDRPAKANFGFHPYFLLADRNRAHVKGLASVDIDMPLTRAPDDVFPCSRPGGVVELRDAVLGCAIHVESPDCGEFVIWNPGSEWPKGGYPEIDDFGSPDDWRHFAAVEPRVGSWKKLPDLAPGETRTLVAEFSVRQL